MFRHLVIQPPARGVGLMGLPVHPLDARGLGRLVHTFDQQTPDPLAARGGVGEQVLQLTGQLDPGGAAVEQEMREAQQLPITLGHQRIHGFVLIEETRPGGGGDFWCQRGIALAAIEGVVASPEGFPGLEVGGLELADLDGTGHVERSKCHADEKIPIFKRQLLSSAAAAGDRLRKSGTNSIIIYTKIFFTSYFPLILYFINSVLIFFTWKIVSILLPMLGRCNQKFVIVNLLNFFNKSRIYCF